MVAIKNGFLVQPGVFNSVKTGMVDIPISADYEGYFDIFGIMSGKKYRDYDAAQRKQIYNGYVSQYPFTGSTPCSTLEVYAQRLTNEVKLHTSKMASNCSGGCQRIESRYKDMANQRLTEVNDAISVANCSAQDQAAQNNQTLAMANSILNSPTPPSQSTGSKILSDLGLGGSPASTSGTQTAVAGTGTKAATTPPKSKVLLYAGLAVGAVVLFIIVKKII
ncbi:MAG: hypothetical protein ACRDE2_00035 [Chitinophagaceae bacterium]